MTARPESGTAAGQLPPPEDAAEDVDHAAAQKASLDEMFGGRAGILDSGLPLALFVAVFAFTQDLTAAVWTAVGAGAVLLVIRLARRERLQNALAGFVGVAVAAWFAKQTGRPEDAFVPALIQNVVYAAVFAISLLVRWPVLGVALGAMFGEGTAWRNDPARRRAYTRMTLLWFAMFGIRLVVLIPLWAAGWLVALGTMRILLGAPFYVLILWLSWLILRQSKPVKPATTSAATGDKVSEH